MVDRGAKGGGPTSAAHGRPARTPLRGRAAELGGALEALRSARQGQPTLLVVSGEPGIGKTALTQAVAEQAHRGGFAVARSTAYAADRVAPLASLGPGLRSGADPLIGSADFMGLAELHGQPLWLVERLATLLEQRAEERPLLFTVDDAQWVDPLTFFALRLLPGRLAASPVVWLLATREVPGGPADQIAEAAGRDVPVVRVGLAALTDDAVLAMAVDRLGPRPDPEVLRRLGRTGGSPFLAAQLLDGLFAPDAAGHAAPSLPTGLVEGVRRRMTATSKECRDLVRAAAVLGPLSVLPDIAHLLGRGPGSLTDPLTESIEAGLLADDGAGVRFRHELLREAVYEDIPPSGRRAWHRAITEHFLASGRGPAAAAPHVLATAQPGDTTAVDLLREAAHEVIATMSITSAAFIRQAFDLTAEDDPRRPQIGAEVVEVLVSARQYAEAGAFADRVLPLATDPDQVATVQLALMPRLWAAEEFGELADRAADVRAAGAAPAPTARLAAYRALAGTSAEAADDALAAARRAGDVTATVVAHAAVAVQAERAGRYATADHAYGRAREAAAGADGGVGAPVTGQLELRGLLARARLDDVEGVLAELADAPPGDPRFPEFWQAPQVAWVRACLCLGAGRLDEAAGHATRSLQLMDDVGDRAFERHVRHVLAEVALLRGDREQARTHLAAVESRGGALPVARALLAQAEGGPRGRPRWCGCWRRKGRRRSPSGCPGRTSSWCRRPARRGARTTPRWSGRRPDGWPNWRLRRLA